jgi:16S rRNA (cytosine1402-N4)-methyltransferase
MDDKAPRHVPVLVDAATDMLVWRRDGVYVDATLGEAGHSLRILDRLEPSGRLIGIDRDPMAQKQAAHRLAKWNTQVTIQLSPFARLVSILDELGIDKISGALFDLGVSSSQIDLAERGFSFQQDGQLDMRMGPDAAQSAHDIVNKWSEADLARILKEYGEERAARRIARNIVGNRPIHTTAELTSVLGGGGRERPEKTYARVFQAIRIAVNGELEELRQGLAGALAKLETGGRIVVISYHSLEDRIVKRWMREESTDCVCPPKQPICTCDHRARLKLLTRGVDTPNEQELTSNPRSRSARLRGAERLPGGIAA